jgi:hypothetical protein
MVCEYSIDAAIEGGYFTPFDYVPHIIGLTDEDADRYVQISRRLRPDRRHSFQ